MTTEQLKDVFDDLRKLAEAFGTGTATRDELQKAQEFCRDRQYRWWSLKMSFREAEKHIATTSELVRKKTSTNLSARLAALRSELEAVKAERDALEKANEDQEHTIRAMKGVYCAMDQSDRIGACGSCFKCVTAQRDRAGQFARQVFRLAFDGQDLCGGDAQEIGHKLGLLDRITFKEATEAGVIIDSAYFDDDDPVYVLTDWLQAMPEATP